MKKIVEKFHTLIKLENVNILCFFQRQKQKHKKVIGKNYYLNNFSSIAHLCPTFLLFDKKIVLLQKIYNI